MSAQESEYSDESGYVDDEDPRWKDEREYCICRGRDNGEFMINCEGCEEWYHGRCVGIAESQGPHIDNYFCPSCTAAGKGHTTYKGLGKRGTETRGDVETSAPKRQKLSLDEKKKFDMHRRREEQERRRAERAEKIRLREEQKKREREELALKAQQEAEEKKKKEEDELKLKREKMRATIASTIEEAFAKDKESNSIDADLLENLKPIPQLAEDIENALFEAFNRTVDKAYLNQYRTLVFNLRDPKNSTLRFRILKGLLKPNVLVTMDSEQLANKDIAQYRQKRDQELLLQTMRPKEVERIYVKTEVGLELVPNPDDEEADLDYVDSTLDSVLDANKAKPGDDLSALEQRGEDNVVNKSESVLSVPGSPLRVSGDRARSHERSESGDDRVATPKTPLKNEQQSAAATPLTASAGAPPLTSSFGANKSIAVDLNDIGDVGDEDMQEPEYEEPDVMDLDNDLKPDPNTFGVSTPENSDDESNTLFAQSLPSSLPTWGGMVKYQFQGLDLSLSLSGFHIEGPEIGENLPRVLKVEHRMDLQQLLDYLPKLDASTSRARTSMYFTVADTDEESFESYARLFTHLKEVQRAGVFHIHKGDAIGVSPTFFKELYIFPLGADDPIPRFIQDSRNYDRVSQNTLIGVFLTDKTASRQKSSISRPPASVITTPASKVTPAQTQAQLDGIASLIAALGKNPQNTAPSTSPTPAPAASPAPTPAPAPVPVTSAPAAPIAGSFNLASLLASVAPGVNPLASLLTPQSNPLNANPLNAVSNPLNALSNPLLSLLSQNPSIPPAATSKPADAPYDPMEATSLSTPTGNGHQQLPQQSHTPAVQYAPSQYPQQPPRDDYHRDRGRDYRGDGGYSHRGGNDHRGGYEHRSGGHHRGRYDDRERGYDRRYDDRDRGGYRGRGRGW